MSGRAPPIGTLVDRVQVQRRQMTAEAEGGHALVFVPLATVWSRVRALSARQTAEAEVRGVAQTHSVVLRYREDIGPGDRILYRGRTLEVVSAADINGHRAYLGCRCVERTVTA